MTRPLLLLMCAAIAVPLAIACGGGSSSSSSASPSSSGSSSGRSTGGATNAAPKELDAATILEQNKASVVEVKTTSPEGDGWGSGIVWQDGTHVLTNSHVVIGAGSVKVVDPADASRSFPAKVVALSPCDDVALLLVDRASGLKPARTGNSDSVKPGDHVVALGYPATISSGPPVPVLTEGNVSRTHATFNSSGQRELVQHTAPINPGNSGGPLFNKFGEVVGLNSYSAIGKQAENYAITINEALAVAEQLKGGKNVDYIGIDLTVNDRQYANENDLAYIDGLAVTAVDPASPADKAKPDRLLVGDLIFEVNGTSVSNVGQFCDIVRSHHTGDTLRLRIGNYDTKGKAYDNFLEDIVVP